MNNTAAARTFALPHQAEYDHTQYSPLPWLILGPVLVILGLAAVSSGRGEVVVPTLAAAAVIASVMLSFRSLRVCDEGEALVLRFGPVPLFRKRFAYDRITAAERDRSSVVDGWGIHWVPGRGWTYNVWGMDCVRLTLQGGRTIRIGTDEPEALAQFLQQKCREANDQR